MIQIIHNSRPASIYFDEDSIYAVYDDNEGDDWPEIFFHVEVDDPSLDVREELEKEFDDETVRYILDDI